MEVGLAAIRRAFHHLVVIESVDSGDAYPAALVGNGEVFNQYVAGLVADKNVVECKTIECTRVGIFAAERDPDPHLVSVSGVDHIKLEAGISPTSRATGPAIVAGLNLVAWLTNNTQIGR